MPNESCILTTKDFTILEVMRDRSLDPEDPLAQILKRKTESAVVMFRDDVPADVATLRSRVTFSIDGRDPDTRVISHDRMSSPVGMFLPITSLRGLALLGLSEGQEFVLTNADGVEERITLDKVNYQPEAARREEEALERLTPQPRKPTLKIIPGGVSGDQPRRVPAPAPGGFDDPGPSAA
ncbi:MAG: nucleoside-diphosphate kinase [Burkholderiaceae bacterium]|nr:nucleoside-diphosphate kinase [Burkholderiaceae bacterium]